MTEAGREWGQVLGIEDERGREPIPRACVVKDGEVPIPRLALMTSAKDTYYRAKPSARVVLYYLIGLWPLVVVVLFASVLLWSAGYDDPTLGR